MKALRKPAVLFVTLLLILAMGCEQEDPLRKGKQALVSENADAAEMALKQALSNNPKDLEAQRLMAEVHLLRGDHAKSEEALDKVWADHKLGDPNDKLSADQKRGRKLVEQQYGELYKAWAVKLDPDKDAATFEKTIARALERVPKHPLLNTKLVEHYFAKAKKQAAAGNKMEAAETLDKILTLRSLKKQQKAAEAEALKLRREAFTAAVDKRVAEISPKLIEEARYKADTKTVVITIEQEIDKKLKPKKDEDTAEAKALTMKQVAPALLAAIREVTGIDESIRIKKTPTFKISTENFERGKYTMVLELPVEAATVVAFDGVESARAAKAQAARTGEKAEGGEAAAPKDGEGAPPKDGETGEEAAAPGDGETGEEAAAPEQPEQPKEAEKAKE